MKSLVVGLGRKIVAIFFIFFVLVSPSMVLAQTESGSVGLEGRVAASAPTESPIITAPENDLHFEQSPITVTGTCESDLLIKIFVNEVFSGSVMCVSGEFSIGIDLYSGENEIIARAFDNLDQAGPDSSSVSVFLDDKEDVDPGSEVAPDVVVGDLRLTSDFARRSANPKEELSWPISVSGGTQPYAIHVDWGDGRDSIMSISVSGKFTAKHTYLYSGIYKVVVRAVDTKDKRAVFQLVAVGKGTSFAPTPDATIDKIKTVILWRPMLLFIVFMIVTFWLGARYERRRQQ